MGIGAFFIRLGRALMLPIAVLPIAGILLRIGQPDVLDIAFISAAGGAVFDNLPVIFAIGVAVGFANDNHGASALAGFVGHAIFVSSLKILLPEANMGVLSGILMGVVAGVLYNRYKGLALPTYLAFFSGTRFIPIITGLAAIILSFVFSYVWPPVEWAISGFGNWIVGSGSVGLFLYGVANRLLIPTGLHHILNSLVWFQFGDYTVIENGVEVVKHGDLWRFFAGDQTAGSFMTGFFPVMMFGLPGAALAMTLLAKSTKRKYIAGIMLSASFTAFLTGITEPLEFSFMFLAFPLYVVHAILTGVSQVIMNMLDVKLGFTFSAGLFDYVLSYGLGRNGWMLIPVGLVYFVLYFVIFYFGIKMFNIKTPGREDESEDENQPSNMVIDTEHQGANFLAALGGTENIIKLDNCTTRLRLDIKDVNLINESALKKLGAKGVVKGVKGSFQVIIGPEVEHVANRIKAVMNK
ncbi:MAG: N-acetylglucosamine-specific PTS transporter subunit IIBC [Alphaproteobacteria bacterium]|jgi:PTS system N-acetylglucosamine-specific IIC component|nr:N-acetylglucosamine-specific PTS transporter subunit IIBC [Alphaproteobacteria bacterium]